MQLSNDKQKTCHLEIQKFFPKRFFFSLKICVCKHWIYYFSSKWGFINDFLVCSSNSMVHIGQYKQGNYWDLPSYAEAIEAFLLYGGFTCFCDTSNFLDSKIWNQIFPLVCYTEKRKHCKELQRPPSITLCGWRHLN